MINAKREEVLTMSANTETTGAVKVGDVFERVTDIDSHRRAGSQFTIEEVDDEYAHWERRLYCLRPKHLLDSTRYRRIGTPPIAAPAAHVERRKVEVGQRRKSHDRTYTIFAIEGRCAFVCQGGDVDSIDGYVHNGGCCWESVSVLEDCELLADAPSEPAKLPGCTPCRVRGGDGLDESCDHTKSPPAQEAPKAAPVLEWSFTDDENRVHRFATGGERDTASRAYGAWMKAQTGKPYSGPERLPRPQLAADWVEDCLPTVWR